MYTLTVQRRFCLLCFALFWDASRPQISPRIQISIHRFEIQVRNAKGVIWNKPAIPSHKWQRSSVYSSLQSAGVAENFAVDKKGYIRRRLIRWGNILCSNAFSHQWGSVVGFFFCSCFFYLQREDLSSVSPISPCPQAVINYRHVSTAQDPTFTAPSLRHGPHHYPHKQQQQQQQRRRRRKASAISNLEEFSPPASLSAASIRHHCGGGFH